MNAVVKLANAHETAPARIALLGTGVVGSAFVARYARLRERGVRLPEIAWLSNSRVLVDCDGTEHDALAQARAAGPRDAELPPWAEATALRAGDIVVDATASEAVADQHANWLLRGVHVVTANKLGNGADWLRAQAIRDAGEQGGACYGDSATVGAGLPLIRSIRELVRGGDRIRRVEGVLSGSLAWLFNHYDGMRPFSGFVRQAREAGYTEPDPRIDLSGEDVRRKLLILARAAGLPLQAADIRVESLVPTSLAALPLDGVDAQLGQLDAPLGERFRAAYRNGEKLRFLGRFDCEGNASVGVASLPADHPLCGGSGTDNKVAIFSDRYDASPLVIQGPGAGAEVTAAALLDDVLKIA
ncbi:homoserine dehydrogenase [Pseudoxanthomonas sangjuensis]|uniref:homoserine dehydrogenase n=1 Tax=Pseudoxanthomonas sangjuensis TaxID=1503750 RepID=UPI001390F183|nr:homoserine dehydrogenase [Pseudoxanthomonas sangjuensis]KAF1713127.1 homoserine dehydrogenase [Pseudoxanthomonas sangjuensis]